MTTLLSCCLLAMSATLPASAGPMLTGVPGEFEIDSLVTWDASFSYPTLPSVAARDSEYFAVWVAQLDPGDHRGYRAYGTRLTMGGRVVDTVSIDLASVGGERQDFYAYALQVVYGAGIWFVVYGGYSPVRFARVDTSMRLQDPVGVLLPAFGQASPHCACFDGANFWVFGAGGFGSVGGIVGYRVAPDGTITDTVLIETRNPTAPSVAYGDGVCLVVWRQETDHGVYHFQSLVGIRVTPDGRVLDRHPLEIDDPAPSGHGTPALCYGDTSFLVAWHTVADTSYGTCIRGSLVGLDGVVTREGFMIDDGPMGQSEPDVTFNGDLFFVAWTDGGTGSYNDVVGRYVKSDGQSYPRFNVSCYAYASQLAPRAVSIGDQSFVIWGDTRYYDYTVFGTRVRPFGAVLDVRGFPVALGGNTQQTGSIAAGPSSYLVTWHNRQRPEPLTGISGAIASEAGVVSPGRMIAAHSGHACAGRDGYLVGDMSVPTYYYGYANAVCRFLSLAGAETDSLWLAYGSILDVHVFGRGDTFLLVAEEDVEMQPPDQVPEITEVDLSARIVTRTGMVLPRRWIVKQPGTTAGNASCAALADTFLIVFEQVPTGGQYWPDRDILCSRMTASGTLLDPVPGPVVSYDRDQFSSAVAGDGHRALVVWLDSRNADPWYASHVYGAFADSRGNVTPVNGFPIVTTNACRSNLKIAYLGQSYLLVWEELGADAVETIQGALVGADGRLIRTFPVADNEYDRRNPVIASSGEDRCLVTYEGYVPRRGAVRLLGQFLTSAGAVEDDPRDPVVPAPGRIAVHPNPFTDRIEITLPTRTGTACGDRRAYVVDAAGRTIRHLAGERDRLVWKGHDERGRRVRAGVYFVVLVDGSTVRTHKIVFLD